MLPSQLCRRRWLVHVAKPMQVKLTRWKAAGTASPCFVTHLMNDEKTNEDVEIIRGCAGLAYAGESGYRCQSSDVLTGVPSRRRKCKKMVPNANSFY